MAIKTVLTENNIGSTLEIVSEANKFNAKIQGVSSLVGNVLSAGPDGKPALTVAALQANSAVAVTNTATVLMAGVGTTANPLNAAVNVSSTAGNALTVDAGGLYAPSGVAQATFAATSTNSTLNITAAGPAGHTPNFAVNLAAVLPDELVEWGTNLHLGQIGA